MLITTGNHVSVEFDGIMFKRTAEHPNKCLITYLDNSLVLPVNTKDSAKLILDFETCLNFNIQEKEKCNVTIGNYISVRTVWFLVFERTSKNSYMFTLKSNQISDIITLNCNQKDRFINAYRTCINENLDPVVQKKV